MRPVRGRRDRCPWDARAFLVREAPETNGRRASTDHAFPREKKLTVACMYSLAFAPEIPDVFGVVSRPLGHSTRVGGAGGGGGGDRVEKGFPWLVAHPLRPYLSRVLANSPPYLAPSGIQPGSDSDPAAIAFR